MKEKQLVEGRQKVRSIVYRLVIMLCCGFLWNASQVSATPVVDQVPCHADKCYTVIVDCPKCCKVHCIKLRFDESGHLEGFERMLRKTGRPA